jgi:glycosyltransferase involved in cell wall biosynthesis
MGQKQAMRVLLLGSAPRSLINFRGPLIEALLARGHEVHAAAPFEASDEAIRKELRSLGAAVHSFPLHRTSISVLSDARALLSLVGLLRRTAPNVLIAYTIKPVIYGMLAASAAGTTQRFAIITGLGYLFTDDKNARRRFTLPVARSLYRRAFARTDKVFFQNPDDEALFRRLNILPSGLPSVIVNGSGVDISLFHVTPFPKLPVTFLMMARLIGAKGIREYAAAAAKVRRRHPEVRFLLAGGRGDEPDSIGQSELDGWEREGTLHWLGRLDDVRPAISAAHVLVLPSYYREGIPRSILEAMAMGRPVITTDSPGCRETVNHGENGLLVPARDVAALADAISRFANHPLMIEGMGQAGRRIAERKYDVDKVNSIMLAEMGL